MKGKNNQSLWWGFALLLMAIPASGIFYIKYNLPAILNENSGVLYKPGTGLWWINDGGNTSDLFLTDSEGKLLSRHHIALRNKDWEELTTDEQGNIYIGDFGNQANYRQDLRIYKLDSAFQIIDSILFTYPDQQSYPPELSSRRFDMEGMVWAHGKIHLFSKNLIKNDGYCVHYILADSGSPQVAKRIENLYLDDYIVSGACRKPGSNKILLLTYYYHFWLGLFPETDSRIYEFRLLNEKMIPAEKQYLTVPTCIASAQYEAITYYVGDTVIISAEGRKRMRPFFRKLKL